MSIKVKGLQKVIIKFTKLAKFDNLDMDSVSTMVHGDIMEHFKQEKGPRAKWKKIKRPGKILQKTGRLRNSIIKSHTRTKAIVSTNLEYAPHHDFGTSKMPKREFMYLSKKAKGSIGKFLGRRIVK